MLILRKIINCYHQMSYFKAKMHQISAEVPSQTPLESFQHSPRAPSWIWGPTCEGKKGERIEWREKGGAGKRTSRRSPSSKFATTPLLARQVNCSVFPLVYCKSVVQVILTCLPMSPVKVTTLT